MKSYKEIARDADEDFFAFERAIEEGRDTGLVPVKADLSGYKGSVFSVRLKPGDMAVISKAADERGMKLGAFMRAASLAAALGEMDERLLLLEELRQRSEALEETVGKLMKPA